MNPWYGLYIIVFVCGFVLVALLVGKKRYEFSPVPGRAGGSAVATPVGLNRINATPSDNRLRF